MAISQGHAHSRHHSNGCTALHEEKELQLLIVSGWLNVFNLSVATHKVQVHLNCTATVQCCFLLLTARVQVRQEYGQQRDTTAITCTHEWLSRLFLFSVAVQRRGGGRNINSKYREPSTLPAIQKETHKQTHVIHLRDHIG